MQVRTRHTPTFGVARLQLAPAETVLADYGALVATSYGVLVEPKIRGGSRGRRRPSTFTAPAEGGWVDLAPAVPGDVHVLELDGLTGWCVARRGVLASAATVVSNTAWSGFRALFGVDIGFLEHASGTGSLVLSCCGMVDMVTLDSGELITVEPGHLLAYTDHTQARLRAASQSLPQSVRTGEGLVLDFAGPGQLLTQTRSPRSFAEWLSAIGDAR
jgi:uncharacterized protein (TIGR00266 family)